MIGARIEPSVKSRTTPTTTEGRAGSIVARPPAMDQRVQLTVLPTAAAGLAKPSSRTALSFSTTDGCRSGLGSGRSSAMSSPLPRAKKRPASGARPCISKKPTSTAPFCTVRCERSGMLTREFMSAKPSGTPDPQLVALTPGRAATAVAKGEWQTPNIIATWLVSSRRASFRANRVWR